MFIYVAPKINPCVANIMVGFFVKIFMRRLLFDNMFDIIAFFTEYLMSILRIPSLFELHLQKQKNLLTD